MGELALTISQNEHVGGEVQVQGPAGLSYGIKLLQASSGLDEGNVARREMIRRRLNRNFSSAPKNLW